MQRFLVERLTPFAAGISLGWGWGSTGCRRGNNHVVANRLENPTRKRCCDGGEVYTLGPQPKSTIERNVLIRHDAIPNELGTGGVPPNAVATTITAAAGGLTSGM